MSKSLKMAMAGVAIMALAANASAHGGDCEYGGPGGMMGMNQERMQKTHEERMAALHDKLQLTAQQEPLWKRFIAQQPLLEKAGRPDPSEMDKLSAPQRMEKGLEHMKALEARLTEHLAVLKELYTVLTPAQQKILDEQMPRFGR